MPKTSRRYWLVKSEPDLFSFDDLLAAPKRRTCWDGVRNYQARNTMRDDMKKGDGVLYYHSSTKPPGIAGVAKVVRESYPDPSQFDAHDSHFDPKASVDDPRWFMVDLEGVAAAREYVPIEALKANPRLSKMAVVQRGQRLSVQPVSAAEWREVLRMAALPSGILDGKPTGRK